MGFGLQSLPYVGFLVSRIRLLSGLGCPVDASIVGFRLRVQGPQFLAVTCVGVGVSV